jgi:RNA polymerase sigma-70 factor (ECF subfamily)
VSDAGSEDVLLQNAVAGDAAALESLLLQHFDRLVAHVAARMPDDVRGPLSAEDVVQDALIVVFQRIAGFQPQGGEAFFGWLARIAENRLMDAAKALRAAKRGGGRQRITDPHGPDADIIPLLESLHVHSRTPSRSAAAHEAAAALTAALEALDPDYRDVLRLRYIEAQPIAVCAERLQRSEGAIYMLLTRALAALRGRLGDASRFVSRST